MTDYFVCTKKKKTTINYLLLNYQQLKTIQNCKSKITIDQPPFKFIPVINLGPQNNIEMKLSLHDYFW